MNFDGALKIYDSVKYEWWAGIVKDKFEDSFYYVGPSEMRYFLYYTKFNYNHELNNELFTIQYELCDDLTQKHPEEYLKTLVDKPIPYVADLNKKQFELTSKYLSYWESELTYNLESELYKRRIRYLQTVRGELKYWFDSNNIKISHDQFIEKVADDSTSIELFSQKKKTIKAIVFEVLERSENKKIALKKLPIQKRKQNKIWELTNEQLCTKLFKEDYKNDTKKKTILRYIKSFRALNS